MGANLAPIHSQYDPIFVLTLPLSLCVYGAARDKARISAGARQWNVRGSATRLDVYVFVFACDW